jgi:hypothetical protein
MLPGVGQHYLVTGAPMQCLTTQLGAEYGKFWVRETLKITAFCARPARGDHILDGYANSPAIVATARVASSRSGTVVASPKPW